MSTRRASKMACAVVGKVNGEGRLSRDRGDGEVLGRPTKLDATAHPYVICDEGGTRDCHVLGGRCDRRCACPCGVARDSRDRGGTAKNAPEILPSGAEEGEVEGILHGHREL